MPLTEARVDAWKTKMRKSALEPLNSARSPQHLQHFVKILWGPTTSWQCGAMSCINPPPSLTATDHGWSGVEDHANITPTSYPSALAWLQWNCWRSSSVDVTATCHVPAIGVDARPMASSAPCSVCVEEAMAGATGFYPFKTTTKLFLKIEPYTLELIVVNIRHSFNNIYIPYATGVSQITTVNIMFMNMISGVLFCSPQQHFWAKRPVTYKMKLKSSKSTKGVASYDLFGYHDRLLNSIYHTDYVYGSPRASKSVKRKNYINKVTLYQSGCLTNTVVWKLGELYLQN